MPTCRTCNHDGPDTDFPLLGKARGVHGVRSDMCQECTIKARVRRELMRRRAERFDAQHAPDRLGVAHYLEAERHTQEIKALRWCWNMTFLSDEQWEAICRAATGVKLGRSEKVII